MGDAVVWLVVQGQTTFELATGLKNSWISVGSEGFYIMRTNGCAMGRPAEAV